MSFAKNFGNKYGKKLMDTATKTGMDATKIAFNVLIDRKSFFDLPVKMMKNLMKKSLTGVIMVIILLAIY